MKIPFPIKTSDGRSNKIRIVGARVPRTRSGKHYDASGLKDSDRYDPIESPEYSTSSVESTNSDSSGAGHEVTLDWTTATITKYIEPEEDAVPGALALPSRKKRNRSFRDKLFRGGRHRPYSVKADAKHNFTHVEALQAPTPVTLPSVVNNETSIVRSQQDVGSTVMNVHSRSVKKLAPPMPLTEYHSFPMPFYDEDLYHPEDEENDSSGEEESTGTHASSAFSIPLSNFLKKTSSWGLSKEPETSVEDASSRGEIVVRERHWGKEVRSRSRGSASWVPTEEERYKVANRFTPGEVDGLSSEVSAFTTNFSVNEESHVSDDSGIEDSVTTEATEKTGETASVYTDTYYTEDDSISEESTVPSVFSLTVDETSGSSEGLRQRPRNYQRRKRHHQRYSSKKQKRLMVESDQCILIEVFTDLRLLAEDMMADDDDEGVQNCLACL